MSILDTTKQTQLSALTTNGIITTFHPAAAPSHASVSWPSYKKSDRLIKWTSDGPLYKDLEHVENTRLDRSTEAITFANPSEGELLWSAKNIPVDYIVEQVRDQYPVLTVDYVRSLQTKVWDDISADFHQRFMKLKYISVDENFSVVNFLLELKELRFVFKNMRKNLKRLRYLLGREARKGKQRSLQTLGDLIASGLLEYAYGVGAFIRDVVTLWKIVCRVADKYRDFMLGMGQLTSARNFVPEPTMLPETTSFERSVDGVDLEFQVSFSRDDPGYTCVTSMYRYWSLALSQSWAKTKFFLTKVGAEPDPSIVWNAIPFSFIFDWIYPIGEWLHRHRIPLIDMNITIDGCGYGAHHSFTYALLARQKPALPHFEGTDWSILTASTYSVYRRITFPIQEVQLPTLQFQGLTLRKATNGAALLWTKLVRS